MLLFPKKDIIPIIVPQICFVDKNNDINNYVEMNPSMFIDESGNVTILVRCVDYKKFCSKKFTIYNMIPNSIYYILNGNINNNEKLDIEKFEYNLLEYTYNLPVFLSQWKGLEDIRFIDKNTILTIVPELNSGRPAIFKAELNNKKVSNFSSCKPDHIEKNWMPYFDNDKNKVIYSLDPFIIKSIDNEDLQEIEIKETIKNKLKGYHGSTNGIILSQYERLFLVHINKNRMNHRWLLFNIETNDVLVSEEFVFFKNSYIEFNCSLSIYNDRIFITMGLNDDKAYIIETCYSDIIETFPKIYNNENNYPTIVTMLYDIRSMEDVHTDRNRKLESFIELSKQFLLKLPFPIIFFIDENKDTYDAIYNLRNELGLLDKTYIYKCDFKTTFFYKYLSRIEELQKQFHIKNGELEHETPLYVILNNNKFDCIERTIELNPFKSSHLLWIDFGINHVARNTEYIFNWINKIPDKIKQMCINPYVENIPEKQYFEYIYHNLAGGLFSGSIENMKKYSELFKNKTEEIYNDNWYQIDEAVMAIIHRENPELFDLFYGDYIGIISNYESPLYNINLILQSSKKYINHNMSNLSFHILKYCLPYYEKNPNCHSVFNFIEQNIIVDYIANNNLLLLEVIDLINLKKKSDEPLDNEIIHNLLENNKLNISYYENNHLII